MLKYQMKILMETMRETIQRNKMSEEKVMDNVGEKVVFMTIISGRKQKDALITALLEIGIHFINTFYGRGTVDPSHLWNAFGLVAEDTKVVITCMAPYSIAKSALKILEDKFDFNKPNTGVAYTADVETVVY